MAWSRFDRFSAIVLLLSFRFIEAAGWGQPSDWRLPAYHMAKDLPFSALFAAAAAAASLNALRTRAVFVNKFIHKKIKHKNFIHKLKRISRCFFFISLLYFASKAAHTFTPNKARALYSNTVSVWCDWLRTVMGGCMRERTRPPQTLVAFCYLFFCYLVFNYSNTY